MLIRLVAFNRDREPRRRCQQLRPPCCRVYWLCTFLQVSRALSRSSGHPPSVPLFFFVRLAHHLSQPLQACEGSAYKDMMTAVSPSEGDAPQSLSRAEGARSDAGTLTKRLAGVTPSMYGSAIGKCGVFVHMLAEIFPL